MTLDSVQAQFDYDYWASRQLLEAITGRPELAEKTMPVMNHIIAASRVWLDRLYTGQSEFEVWPEWNTQAAGLHLRKNNLEWEVYLQDLESIGVDMASTIRYKTKAGDSFENVIQDIICHVLLHATYHRGQVTQMLREADIVPPTTDFIVYQREKKS